MKKFVYSIMLSSAVVLGANAHEIWLELDQNKKEAKLFFGHYAENEKENGKNFERIQEGVAYPKEFVKSITRNDNNITYSLTKNSDIVVVQEGEPRLSRATNTTTKRVVYSKAGISSKKAITKFDIVAVDANKNTFKLVLDGKALAKNEINVISPSSWTKKFMTDDKGEFTINTPWKGGYLIQAKYEDDTKGESNGKAFDKTVHFLTLNLNIDKGLDWKN
ncbi:hypothetical protein [Arcobacter porcinus]|uniref:hypothetical protein n=1 Tax=Arcobacter porcinus TaxID=1935204 RepID=UPI00081E149B|nr:hypothetical protein [Arcobacter porcinus]OCL81771.1 Nickel uptake substrate-specific transmembrane region [Arcobacter porcinus]